MNRTGHVTEEHIQWQGESFFYIFSVFPCGQPNPF
jgi:hypothetical protein